MSGITITDGLFGCGEMLAKRLSDLLGYRYLGEEALIKATQRYRLPKAMPTNMFELEPPWWKRLLENYRVYRIALQAAMCDITEGGPFVYYGAAGQELIPEIRQMLRILLIAPNENRIEQVRLAKGMSSERARRWLAEIDEVNDRRFKAIFGVGWRDPTRYDVVLNMANLDVETAARLIVKMTQQVECQATGQSERRFQDFMLEAKVRAALLASANTCRMDLKVQVNSRIAHVSGFLFPLEYDFKDEIIRVIEAVPGVNKVTADIRLLPNDDSVPVIPENSL
jgi:hypothetical protein